MRIFNIKSLFVLLVLLVGTTLMVGAQDLAATVIEEEGPDLMTQQGALLFKYYALMAFASVLFLIVLGKAIKAWEMSTELTGKKVNISWNKINGWMMAIFGVLFVGLTCWEMNYHGKMILPESASLEGAITDGLFMTTFWITVVVFVITHILLFYFSFKYKYDKNRFAFFFPHNDRLEIYWTIAPAIVLSILVLTGIKTWNNIAHPAEKQALTIDLTAYQFGWTARYAGPDNLLGKKSFKLINETNTIGVDYAKDVNASDDYFATEIVLPVGKLVKFQMGAKDVIHSAYMPHFRAQMNCVPGMPTQFYFTPSITTASMRIKLAEDAFDYVLLCNKICGNAHFNMQKKIRVVTVEEYEAWLKEQKPFYAGDMKKLIDEAQAETLKNATKPVAIEGEGKIAQK